MIWRELRMMMMMMMCIWIRERERGYDILIGGIGFI